MTEEQRHVQTVTGPVPTADLGLVLPHEHLFNDLSSVLDAPSYEFSRSLAGQRVSASAASFLRHDPYCCMDNISAKPIDDVLHEVEAFRAVGGGTLVDVTPSSAIGRDPVSLRETSQRSGINIVMGCGAYLEKFEDTRINATAVDGQAQTIDDELTRGTPDHHIRPGLIGEIGVSPDFTPAEGLSLRAAALAQLNHPHVPLMIHLPGWQRRAHEVLDIVLDEMGVAPDRVVLAHMDPSSPDTAYQFALAERGVWLEFDMIGMDVTFPHEGSAPSAESTADAVAGLTSRGHAGQLLLSHDLFLKQMWTQHGGNGLTFVPTIFTEMLLARDVDHALVRRLTHHNPARMLAGTTDHPVTDHQ